MAALGRVLTVNVAAPGGGTGIDKRPIDDAVAVRAPGPMHDGLGSGLVGDVIGDLNSRRGRVGGMEQRGNAQVIGAVVPLSEMFGYSTSLRSLTEGRGNYTMEFDHYEVVPGNVEKEIVEKRGK